MTYETFTNFSFPSTPHSVKTPEAPSESRIKGSFWGGNYIPLKRGYSSSPVFVTLQKSWGHWQSFCLWLGALPNSLNDDWIIQRSFHELVISIRSSFLIYCRFLGLTKKKVISLQKKGGGKSVQPTFSGCYFSSNTKRQNNSFLKVSYQGNKLLLCRRINENHSYATLLFQMRL